MPEIPDGAQRSEDGNYWWDGSQWQPVEGGAASGASGETAGEVTPELLEPLGDTGPEPGNEEALTEQTKPYFAGFDGEDDLAEAERPEVLDDSQFVGEEA